IGYPLLSPHTLLILPTRKVVARDTYAALHQNEYNVITTPKDNQPEMCYYHTLKKDSDGQTLVGAYEPTLKIGFYVTFSTAFLNHFVQWKSMGSGEYVLGLEPCSCTIEGCNHAREDGTLQHLAKGASLTNTLHFTWFCGDDAYEELVRRINTFL
ncbi:MAG: DUF4432 family protein, partial [Ruthenibacterium sp.]